MNFPATILLISLSQASGAMVRKECPITGDALHWQTDYCLLVSETDDIFAATPCLERQSRRVFRSSCTEKFHYKREMCEIVTGSGGRPGKVDDCVKDPDFMGATVRNGGA